MGSHHLKLLCVLLLAIAPSMVVVAQKDCQEACNFNEDCSGILACISGKCGDDPQVGTNICSSSHDGASQRRSGPSRGNGKCKPVGFLRGVASGHDCEECCKDGVSYPRFACSPPVTSSTPAVLTLNDFSDGGDGGDASSCDGKFHNGDVEKVVALSTGWFDNRSRCNRQIVILGIPHDVPDFGLMKITWKDT